MRLATLSLFMLASACGASSAAIEEDTSSVESATKTASAAAASAADAAPAAASVKDLGLKNVGATCYANAALKLAWLATGNKADRLSPLADVEELPADWRALTAAKSRARVSVRNILNGLTRANQGGGAPSPMFDTQLKETFDALDEYVQLQNADGTKRFSYRADGGPAILRKHLMDGSEFLTRLFDIVDYGDVARGGRFATAYSFTNGDTRVSGLTAPSMIQVLSIDAGTKSTADAWAASVAPEVVADQNKLVDPFGRDEMLRRRVAIADANPAHDPPMLMVQLARFTHAVGAHGAFRAVKITREIEPSANINVDYHGIDEDYLPPTFLRTVSYRFRGAMVHRDGRTAASGHYVAYLYDSARATWVLHDDTKTVAVSVKDAMEAIRKNGYVFYYRR